MRPEEVADKFLEPNILHSLHEKSAHSTDRIIIAHRISFQPLHRSLACLPQRIMSHTKLNVGCRRDGKNVKKVQEFVSQSSKN